MTQHTDNYGTIDQLPIIPTYDVVLVPRKERQNARLQELNAEYKHQLKHLQKLVAALRQRKRHDAVIKTVAYNKALPRINNELWLTRLVRPFPVTAGEILEVATSWSFGEGTIEFLHLFAENETFETAENFSTRCRAMELTTREAREILTESLHGSQAL